MATRLLFLKIIKDLPIFLDINVNSFISQIFHIFIMNQVKYNCVWAIVK